MFIIKKIIFEEPSIIKKNKVEQFSIFYVIDSFKHLKINSQVIPYKPLRKPIITKIYRPTSKIRCISSNNKKIEKEIIMKFY